MKKYLTIFLVLGILTACSDKTEENTPDNTAAAETPAPKIDYAQKSFHFSKDSLTAGCEDDSEIICAINLAVKCSINPKFAECDKSKMPKFIFMEDESLQRPTESGYKITKLKPIAEGQMEVYTQSQCNGQWFGLCNGNIIYVMGQKDGHWVVKDLYAMQTIN